MKTRLTLLSLLLAVHSLPAQQRPGNLFDRWDRNQDGKLAPDELPEPIRRNFARIDTDQDGFISREEDAEVQKRRAQNPGGPRGGSGGAMLEGIKKIADLDYADSGNPRQKLDLYLPEKPAGEGPLPLVVFIHGGGWQNGDKNGGGAKVARFVASGKYAGASIGYRLSDEAQWPSQIHDCKAAIRWLKAHAGEYGYDPTRIAVWGTSAGGHLVAMLGVSNGVDDLEGNIGKHTDQDASVRCVLDFFGPTEMLTMGSGEENARHNAPDSPESKLLGGAVLENPDKAKSASPVEHVTSDDAPYLIVHGSMDKTVPFAQSTTLEKKLEAVGVPAILVTVEGGGHGQGFGPAVDAIVDRYLAKQLLGVEDEIVDQTVKAGQ